MLLKANELSNAIPKHKYLLVVWTDKVDFVNEIQDFDKVLEVYSFDESGEFRALRTSVFGDFKCKIFENDKDYIDEGQYVDIDELKTSVQGNNDIFTIGGGKYHLPKNITNTELLKIVIRKFYKYDDNGIAYFYDWRFVDFVKGEAN